MKLFLIITYVIVGIPTRTYKIVNAQIHRNAVGEARELAHRKYRKEDRSAEPCNPLRSRDGSSALLREYRKIIPYAATPRPVYAGRGVVCLPVCFGESIHY